MAGRYEPIPDEDPDDIGRDNDGRDNDDDDDEINNLPREERVNNQMRRRTTTMNRPPERGGTAETSFIEGEDLQIMQDDLDSLLIYNTNENLIQRFPNYGKDSNFLTLKVKNLLLKVKVLIQKKVGTLSSKRIVRHKTQSSSTSTFIKSIKSCKTSHQLL